MSFKYVFRKGEVESCKKKCVKPSKPSKRRCYETSDDCTESKPPKYEDSSDSSECSSSCSSSSSSSPCSYACGCSYIHWSSKDGCLKYRSKIVSAVDEEDLVHSIDKKIEFVAGLFNSTTSTDPAGFAYQFAHLGCFAQNTSIVSLADTPPNTYVGVEENASLFANVFSAIKIAHPDAVLSISYVYRIVSNDLVDVTYIFKFSYLVSGVPGSTVITVTTQSHVLCCGKSFPPIDFGTVTLHVNSGPKPQ